MTNKRKVGTKKQHEPAKVHQQIADPFRRLGKSAPIFRVLLAGVKFPVHTPNDLLKKAGGKKRMFNIAGPSGLMRLYSVQDILEAMPELEGFYPLKSIESMIDYVIEIDRQFTCEDGPKLINRIGNSHLKAIQAKQTVLQTNTHKKPLKHTLPILRPLEPPIEVISNQLLMLLSNSNFANLIDYDFDYVAAFRASFGIATTHSTNASNGVLICENSMSSLRQQIETYINDRDPERLESIDGLAFVIVQSSGAVAEEAYWSEAAAINARYYAQHVMDEQVESNNTAYPSGIAIEAGNLVSQTHDFIDTVRGNVTTANRLSNDAEKLAVMARQVDSITNITINVVVQNGAGFALPGAIGEVYNGSFNWYGGVDFRFLQEFETESDGTAVITGPYGVSEEGLGYVMIDVTSSSGRLGTSWAQTVYDDRPLTVFLEVDPI